MDNPTSILSPPTISHPYTMTTGPPLVNPLLYRVVTPVITEMIENENAKFETTLQLRTRPMNKNTPRIPSFHKQGKNGRQRSERKEACWIELREITLEFLLVTQLAETRLAGVSASVLNSRSKRLSITIPTHIAVETLRTSTRKKESSFISIDRLRSDFALSSPCLWESSIVVQS